MPILFGRVFEVSIGNRKFTRQRVAFEVNKTVKPDPNTAEIKIYNLNEDERLQISRGFQEQVRTGEPNTGTLVRLFAGYEDTLPTQIFYGNLLHVQHAFDDKDIITTLSTGDGSEAYKKTRVQASFGPNTQASSVFRTLTQALKLKPGNSQRALDKLLKSQSANMYVQGTVLTGSAAHELTQLCRSAGLQWSIQDGAYHFVDLKQVASKTATVLSPRTGLIGSPTISNKGVLSARALIIPGLQPGLQVKLQSRFVEGNFLIAKVRYAGDTHGNDWYADIEAVTLDTSPELALKKRQQKKYQTK